MTFMFFGTIKTASTGARCVFETGTTMHRYHYGVPDRNSRYDHRQQTPTVSIASIYGRHITLVLLA